MITCFFGKLNCDHDWNLWHVIPTAFVSSKVKEVSHLMKLYYNILLSLLKLFWHCWICIVYLILLQECSDRKHSATNFSWMMVPCSQNLNCDKDWNLWHMIPTAFVSSEVKKVSNSMKLSHHILLLLLKPLLSLLNTHCLFNVVSGMLWPQTPRLPTFHGWWGLVHKT